MNTILVAEYQAGPENQVSPHLIAQFISCGMVLMTSQVGSALIFPAACATAAQVSFAVRHSTGLIHAALRSSRLDHLRIPDQPVLDSEDSGCRFTVAVDATHQIGTGISSRDRARTLRVLADPCTTPTDLTRPGHVVPIRCADSPRPVHRDRWDIAIRLVEMAGYAPVAAACELVTDGGDVLEGNAARLFADVHRLPVLDI
uniref:3,4-dihydroxy-2-butanone-4-phosphate synthase n=1 Tax=Mycolicibacterium brisbanense TaxID=146020 RepID=B8R4H5_9MYCO|nr:putative 3,4-dihydroxy-2-butanone 4-phosphate synthase [Mycolicibacterium brisbanense]